MIDLEGIPRKHLTYRRAKYSHDATKAQRLFTTARRFMIRHKKALDRARAEIDAIDAEIERRKTDA